MTATTVPHEIKDFVGHLQYDILEDDEKTGRMKIRGLFQRADTKNANGRIYTSSLWEKVLGDPKLNEAIQQRRMLGEVEHPKDGVTNLSRVSHIVTGLKRHGDAIMGDAEVLNTPAGRIIQELFRSGVQVGISSRGRGTSQLRGGVEYVDETNFQLDTFDFVFKPSTPGAYPKLQESVLQGPYGKDSTMDEKLNELKRLEVRAMDILGAAGKKELSHEEMQSWYEECIELEASSDTLLSNLSEEEAQEHGEYAEAVSNKITEARGLVISKLDSFHESHDTALDQRANMAMAGAVVESESKDDPKDETTRKTESPVIRDLTAALKEALESRDYYRGRLAETMEVLESDEDELKQRYLAAKKLGEELLSRLQQSESEMADLAHAHEALEERYQAAVALVAGVTERQDRARLMKKVREAIEMHPELQAFHKSLLACTTPDELEERLREYMEALDLPVQDKEEAMESQVTISAAKEETDGDVDEGTATDDEDDGEGPMGENSELPSAGESINESEDPEVLDGAPLLENHEDRGASVAHRAVKRMGLK